MDEAELMLKSGRSSRNDVNVLINVSARRKLKTLQRRCLEVSRSQKSRLLNPAVVLTMINLNS